jgi:hypothetical protein
MCLITDISTIITGLYPDATFTLSSKFKANYESFLTEAANLPLIVLNNEIPKDNEIKVNNNVLKNTRIAILVLSLDSVENSDSESEAIRAEMELYADRIAANIYQEIEVRPTGRQKYKCTPEFHVFNSNLTGVALDMNVNFNEIVNFLKP